MVRALLILASLAGVAVFSQAPDARATAQNGITATSSVNYLVPVNTTFTVSLGVDCTTTPCVGYQYQLGYNPAIVSFVSEATANPSGFTLCPNATILPPPWAGMYGGCLRPDGVGQSANANAATVTFMCNAYGIAALTLPAYDPTTAPFGARTVPVGGGTVTTTLSSANILCTNNVASDDADGDGCTDLKEVGADWHHGGLRDPTSPWDFFDVPTPPLSPSAPGGTRNKVISLSDVLAVLQYVGTSAANPNTPNANGVTYGSDWNGNGIQDGREYDRTPSTDPAFPWRSGPPNGVVSLADVTTAQAQVGSNCQ